MAILTLGVSFRRAPIELLERLAFADDDLVKAYRDALDLEGVDEAVILSTCNRVEIYANVASYHAGFLALKRLLTETRGVRREELAEPLYSHWEQDAADHLFAVASGLDSMVLGETQIYAQVREALRTAEARGRIRPRALTALFHAAARAGRRVRQETSLGAAPDAFVALGADLAEDAAGGLRWPRRGRRGRGQMAALAVKHLRQRGVGPVRMLNRSLEHARALAERTSAEHGDLDAAPRRDRGSRPGRSRHRRRRAGDPARGRGRRARRTGRRPLVLLDLAVPRDVEPETAVRRGGPRDRHRLAPRATRRARRRDGRRHRARPRDRGRGGPALGGAPARRRARTADPRDAARGDEAVRAELDRFASRLAELTPEQREAVEALARGVAAKLLHDPIVALKERSEPGHRRDLHARLLAELLGVDPDDRVTPSGSGRAVLRSPSPRRRRSATGSRRTG